MKRNYYVVALILFVFFVISFLTNIMGPLVILYLSLGYILAVGFWVKPLISNKTVSLG